MSQNTEGNKSVHLAYLDSVRGIAAMIVVIYHFLNWDYADNLKVKLANFIFNGADAVAFFFVLSGFVLSYKYLVLKHKLDIGKFIVNRLFRLWPAFFITVIINALYHTWLHAGLDGTTLVDLFIKNKNTFWEEALLFKRSSYVYYVPGWTLTIELILSFFIPFAVIIGHKSARYMWWLAGFFFIAMPGLMGIDMFLVHFVLGALVAAYFNVISGSKFHKSVFSRYRYIFIPLGMILFSMRPLEKLTKLGWFYDKIIFEYLGYEVYYFSAVGSFILLVYIIHSKRLHKLLELGILRFFGKISYGLYLMHWLPVLWVFNNREWLSAYFPGEKVAFFALMAGCVLVTIVMAVVVYYCVELPFIKWGKRLTSRMKPTIEILP